jgi:hypothetical protein
MKRYESFVDMAQMILRFLFRVYECGSPAVTKQIREEEAMRLAILASEVAIALHEKPSEAFQLIRFVGRILTNLEGVTFAPNLFSETLTGLQEAAPDFYEETPALEGQGDDELPSASYTPLSGERDGYLAD